MIGTPVTGVETAWGEGQRPTSPATSLTSEGVQEIIVANNTRCASCPIAWPTRRPGSHDVPVTWLALSEFRYCRHKCCSVELCLSVHEMRLGLKWHRQTFSGCRGSSVYGRNLGTSAQCSNVFPRQEEPHGRARCRDESSGRRAGSPGASAVCPGTGRHARGARSGEGHLQAVAAHWIGGDEAVLRPARDRRCGTGRHACRRHDPAAGEAAAGAGLLLALRQVRGGPDVLPHARGARDLPTRRTGQPPGAVLFVLPAGMDDLV